MAAKALAAVLFVAALAVAEERRLTILSDGSWKVSPERRAGWEAPDFDDSSWAAAVAVDGPDGHGDHYKVPNVLGFPTKARWIWFARADLNSTAWFRRAFEVPAGVRTAEMIYIADDHAHVCVNGEKADSYTTWDGQWGHRGCAVFLDLTPWIREGRNVVAVECVDDMGAFGFAAEIRIDGDPMVPRLRGGDETLPEGGEKRLREYAKELEDGAKRDEATKKIFALSREFGLAAAPALDALAEEAKNGDVASRLGQAIDAAVPQLMPSVWGDGRFAYGRMTLAALEAHLFSEKEPGCLFRWAVSTQVRAHLEPGGVARVVRRAAEDGTGLSAERAARFIGALDFEFGRETLLEILAARPKSRAGAFAAAGLARIGKPEDRAAIEKACGCGFAPTARACAAALRALAK
jgi:hypothetical protein